MTKLQKDLQTLMVEFNSLTDENSSYGILIDKYLPEDGQGESKASQLVTAANKIIYGWYNNGDTISGNGNDLTSYANWIDKYIIMFFYKNIQINIILYQILYISRLKSLLS